jgi:predicted methyltransferase
MKKVLLVVLISVFSSVTTLLVCQHFFPPKATVIQKSNSPAIYTNFLEQSQLPKGLYYSSAPTDFTEAANEVTPAVVYIKSSQKNRSSLDVFW